MPKIFCGKGNYIKNVVRSGFFFGFIILAVQGCALLALPMTTTVIGGAELAIKGAELQKELRKADVRIALDRSLEQTLEISAIALRNLRIEITQNRKNKEGNGAVIEGRMNNLINSKIIKIELAVVGLTENITEIGIWTKHDKALADLIANKIREEIQKKESHPEETHLPI